jgi:D-alanyl-lipoteichoic acid acyltransferase DltB (MBOAT superfamily)
MLFNSIEFALFFPAVLIAYALVPQTARWLCLLIASYLFYMAWEPAYLGLILASTCVDYAAARRMGALPDRRARRPWLALSLAANLGMLFTFKYYNFFLDVLPAGTPLPVSHLLLPVGISFYTFQTLSYSIEVYRGEQQPERHVGRFALFVAFFPQLVAGPIERAGKLLPQLRVLPGLEYERTVRGLQQMAWGLIQKVVIADRLAIAVDKVYADPAAHSGPALAMATVMFAFQIYCDFAGYCDIAIGAARIFGVDLSLNFRRPYFAWGFRDFWARWHITLSTWFRDYLYVPLGGNRLSQGRWAVNILIVFLVSGLWHGANWTFVAWGGLHGLYLLGERLAEPMLKRVSQGGPAIFWKLAGGALTFALVCAAWVFFRSPTIGDAFTVYRGLGTGWAQWQGVSAELGLYPGQFALCLALIAALLGVHLLQTRMDIGAALRMQPRPLRWLAYSAGLWVIFLLGVFQEKAFIYFTF